MISDHPRRCGLLFAGDGLLAHHPDLAGAYRHAQTQVAGLHCTQVGNHMPKVLAQAQHDQIGVRWCRLVLAVLFGQRLKPVAWLGMAMLIAGMAILQLA